MKLKKLDVITIRTLNDAYEHIKNGENVLIMNDYPSKCGIVTTKKIQYIHFHEENFLRVVSVDSEKGCHPGTGGRYIPSKTEDFRHKAMIPIYRLGEVCTDVIESGWKGATVMIGGEMVIFRFDPSVKSYIELTTFMSA